METPNAEDKYPNYGLCGLSTCSAFRDFRANQDINSKRSGEIRALFQRDGSTAGRLKAVGSFKAHFAYSKAVSVNNACGECF